MKLDRVFVFVVATIFWVGANVLPNNFPQKDYGRGFPMKWSYDPLSRNAHYSEDSPYRRTYSPPELWVFDSMGLTIDIVVGIFVVALALGVNEIWQTTCGNRSPTIPPNDRV
jgi:hypothetical protein